MERLKVSDWINLIEVTRVDQEGVDAKLFLPDELVSPGLHEKYVRHYLLEVIEILDDCHRRQAPRKKVLQGVKIRKEPVHIFVPAKLILAFREGKNFGLCLSELYEIISTSVREEAQRIVEFYEDQYSNESQKEPRQIEGFSEEKGDSKLKKALKEIVVFILGLLLIGGFFAICFG
jgi:hypothetical protein